MKKAISIHAIVFDKFLFTSEEATAFAQQNDFSVSGERGSRGFLASSVRPEANFEMTASGPEQEFRSVVIVNGGSILVSEVDERITKSTILEKHVTRTYLKVDEAKRVVTGPVLVPDTVDLEGDFEFPEDIQEAAFKFMEDARNIGEMHTKFGGIGVPVESWILREAIFVDKGMEFKIYPAGTWMMSVKVTDDKVWEKVRNGELTGFSIGFRGTREEA